MIHQFFKDKRPHNGLSYQAYIERFAKLVDSSAKDANTPAADSKLLKLNLQRFNRIYRTHKLNENLATLISRIEQPQLWMIITHDKCGDSAQLIPIIARLTELNDKIDLKIIMRDSNLHIMDLYLTGKSRSVPKLVAFDVDGNELFQWGPRPVKAQEFYSGGLKDGRDKSELNQELHSWYARDKGASLEMELEEILSELLSAH